MTNKGTINPSPDTPQHATTFSLMRRSLASPYGAPVQPPLGYQRIGVDARAHHPLAR